MRKILELQIFYLCDCSLRRSISFLNNRSKLEGINMYFLIDKKEE